MTDRADTDWRRRDRQHVRNNWRRRSDAELAADLGRTERAVAVIRVKMGLRRPRGGAANASGPRPRSRKEWSRFWTAQHGYVVTYWTGDLRVREQWGAWWWRTNVGPVPEGKYVAYADDDRRNDSPSNLVLRDRIGTSSTNLASGRAKYAAAGRPNGTNKPKRREPIPFGPRTDWL